MTRDEIIKEAQAMYSSMCVMESNYLDAWEWMLKIATLDGHKMTSTNSWEKEDEKTS